MLYYALVFLVLGIVAAALGAFGVAAVDPDRLRVIGGRSRAVHRAFRLRKPHDHYTLSRTVKGTAASSAERARGRVGKGPRVRTV